MQNVFIRLILSLLLYSANVGASELRVIGFAFSGENTSISSRFPYLSQIEQDNLSSNESISRIINNRLQPLTNPNIIIVKDGSQFSVRATDQAITSVLLMTGETVLIENYGNYYKVFINLRADALIFDYKSKSILKTYPLNLVIFDAVSGNQPPSQEYIKNKINEYIKTTNKEGLISQYLEKVQHATLVNKGVHTFQIGKVEVLSDAVSIFPENFRNDSNLLKDVIADSFGSALTSETNISLMPSKVGNALGVISMKLENNDDFVTLKIGDADYLFDVSVNKFVKVKQQETSAQVSYLYGVSTTINLYEPLSNTKILESNFKNGEISISPINKISTDDYPAYYDTLNNLFKKLSSAIKTNDMKWVNVSASSPVVSKQIVKIKNLFEEGM